MHYGTPLKGILDTFQIHLWCMYLEHLTFINDVIYTCQQHEVVNNSNKELMSPTGLCFPRYIFDMKRFEMYKSSPPKFAGFHCLQSVLSVLVSGQSCPLIGSFFFTIHFLNKMLKAVWVTLALRKFQCTVLGIR